MALGNPRGDAQPEGIAGEQNPRIRDESADAGKDHPATGSTADVEQSQADGGGERGGGIVRITLGMSDEEIVDRAVANHGWLVRQPDAVTEDGIIALSDGFIDSESERLIKMLVTEAINVDGLYFSLPDQRDGYHVVAGEVVEKVSDQTGVSYTFHATWNMPLTGGKTEKYAGLLAMIFEFRGNELVLVDERYPETAG